MTLTSPAALWLLAAVPLIWLAQLVARTNFNARQRRLQAAVRSLLLCALALALARPVISTSSSRESIVYAVDVSHSVSGHAIEAAARAIDGFNGALRPAHWRIVAFGATAATLQSTDALRALGRVESKDTTVDRRVTDVEAALDTARGELAAGHVPRIVLFSDGHATAGDTGDAVTRLAAARIPVSVAPMAPRALGDAWVDSLQLPDRIVAGAPFTAIVGIGSQRNGNGSIQLRADQDAPVTRSIALASGTTRVPIETVIEKPGAATLQVSLSVANDPLSVNNTIDRGIWTEPKTKVLYVEGTAASARYLSGALTQSGFDVTLRAPAALPSTAAELDAWDVVVLSDVSRGAMRDPSLNALTEWVERRGGGLLIAGGESVFGEGAGGYRRSSIERLTPVTFERKDEPEVALILVLDRSWSMAGTSMDLCKAAAQAAVDVLTDEQSVGILTFNDSFNWDVPLRNVGANRDGIRKRIAAIGPGGHTLIYPAVEQAYLALKPAKARAKHVVLLSDGRSYPADYETLVKQMVDAHMTVSSVAVGPAADPELLANIAKWGKGRTYAVSDARELPQIFVKEAKNASSPSFDEKEITAVVKSPGFLTGVDLSRLPPLKGRTATVLKDTALEVLATGDEDPLLAFWPIGLGRTAVFASDVKDRWAAEWLRWRGYGPFFTSVIRALERPRTPPVSLQIAPGPVRGDTRAIAIGVEARDADRRYRNLLHPVVQIQGAGSASAPMRQVAPGRYEATVTADARQPISFTVREGDASATRSVLPDPGAEYRFRTPDETALRTIASATGGAWAPDAPSLANARGDRRTRRRPFAAALILLALALWLLDLLLRRVRVLEPSVLRSAGL